MTFQKGW